MTVCSFCNDTTINLKTGEQCSCVIKKSLMKAMHPVLLDAKPSPRTHYFPVEHLRSFKSIICTTPRATFNSLVKYYFSLEYIINGGRYTHLFSTGRELTDSFLSGDYEAEKPYLQVDFLILSIINCPENKYMSEMIPYVVQQRSSLGKRTWINTTQIVYQTKETKYKGMLDIMLNEKIITYVNSFVPLGWGRTN